MNEVIKQLKSRKSVRVFEDRSIPEEHVREILASAGHAPTAGNQQLYTIIRVTDPKLLEALSISCDDQPFIAESKLALVFCADCRKWYKAYEYEACEPRKPGAGDLMLAVVDTAIAAQNAVTAAESMGIGSCYIGDILENCETQRELLGLPEYVVPAVMVVFGYPTQQQKDRIKPVRTELSHLVFENRYPELTREEVRAMFEPKTNGREYRSWMQAFCKRKYNSDFSGEMTRSVEEYLKQFR